MEGGGLLVLVGFQDYKSFGLLSLAMRKKLVTKSRQKKRARWHLRRGELRK